MTTVVNIRSVETWTAKHVYIGRAATWRRKRLPRSPFANPFRIGRDGDRYEVIAKWGPWASSQPGLLERIRRELTDKILVCWCSPKACHGDILAALCDQPKENNECACT